MQAISVKNLEILYRQPFTAPVKAVTNLSFDIEFGEIVGFIGLNGAGKTSTIKALMGFQPPEKGDIQILGKAVGSSEGRDSIGFLPEVAMYSPYLTPRETLRFFGNLSGMSGALLRDRVEEMLSIVKLQDKAKTLNRSLSKGMLQRVGIAQALLSAPQILILDEVSSGIDPVGRRDLRELLLDQKAKGVTIFFSSHELSEVEAICDRVLIIHRGKLLKSISAAALKEEVGSIEDYFVDLVADHDARTGAPV